MHHIRIFEVTHTYHRDGGDKVFMAVTTNVAAVDVPEALRHLPKAAVATHGDGVTIVSVLSCTCVAAGVLVEG